LRAFAKGLVQGPLTVAEQVANVLREAIADGSLAVAPDDLALRFGFSRMPIRDALRQLEAEGIVSIHPTKGAQEAPPLRHGTLAATRWRGRDEARHLISSTRGR